MVRNTRSDSSFSLITGTSFIVIGIAVFFGNEFYIRSVSKSMRGILVQNRNTIVSFAAIFILLGLLLVAFGFDYRAVERRTIEKVRGLSQGKGASPKEFLNSRNALTRNGDFTGIYIFHNKTKGMYYVGQSTRVVGRVMQHLAGHGNGDVYADYKYGDEFEINLVSLRESGYDSLDALERDAIKTYNAYAKGYNRTRGNRN